MNKKLCEPKDISELISDIVALVFKYSYSGFGGNGIKSKYTYNRIPRKYMEDYDSNDTSADYFCTIRMRSEEAVPYKVKFKFNVMKEIPVIYIEELWVDPVLARRGVTSRVILAMNNYMKARGETLTIIAHNKPTKSGKPSIWDQMKESYKFLNFDLVKEDK